MGPERSDVAWVNATYDVMGQLEALLWDTYQGNFIYDRRARLTHSTRGQQRNLLPRKYTYPKTDEATDSSRAFIWVRLSFSLPLVAYKLRGRLDHSLTPSFLAPHCATAFWGHVHGGV